MELMQYHFYRLEQELEIIPVPNSLQYYYTTSSNTSWIVSGTYDPRLYDYLYGSSLANSLRHNFTIGHIYYCYNGNTLLNNEMQLEFIEANNLDKFVEVDVGLSETSVNFLRNIQGKIKVKFDVNDFNLVLISAYRTTPIGLCSAFCMGKLWEIDNTLYRCYRELRKDYCRKLQKVFFNKWR